MNKWTLWYENLPQNTKEYLKNQPVWHDRDIFKAVAFGIFVGMIIGICI